MNSMFNRVLSTNVESIIGCNGNGLSSRIVNSIIFSYIGLIPVAFLRAITIAIMSIDSTTTPWCSAFQNALQYFSPYFIVILVSFYWAGKSNLKQTYVIIFSLMAFILTEFIIHGDVGVERDIDIPVAIFMAISSCYLFEFIYRGGDFLSLIIDHVFVVFAIIFLGIIVLNGIDKNILSLLNQHIYPDSFWHGLYFVILRGAAWFFGVNGGLFLQGINDNFAIDTANNIQQWQQHGAALHILSPSFYQIWCEIGGSGCTAALLICLLLDRSIIKKWYMPIFVLSAVFNVNEPLLFAIPIIFNPLMFIPFILTPIMAYVIAYAATAYHLVPHLQVLTIWTTPLFLNAWIASKGSFRAELLQVAIILLGVLIYTPFWRWHKKNNKNRFVDITNSIREFSPSGLLNVQLYNHILKNSLYIESMTIVKSLRKNGHFILWFQPQINIKSKQVVGLEALIRYQANDGVIYSPTFLSHFERLEMMYEIDFWVLEEAIWHMQNVLHQYPDVTLSINISPDTLMSPEFLNRLDSLLTSPLPRNGCLEIEITESIKLNDLKQVSNVLEQIRKKGIAVALDDFGAGYSTLSYILHLQLDKIKLDRSLVQGFRDKNGIGFFNQLVKVCCTTQSQILVEGIENADDERIVAEAGVTFAQGYLYYKPMPLASVCDVLSHQQVTR